jgi:hypothetical protein
MDLTALDEKVEGRNLNLESNAPKGQFTPVSFPTLARYAKYQAWVAAEHHPWKDLRQRIRTSRPRPIDSKTRRRTPD